jgi:Tol biopolymer transport system component/DNA-binding winged helix-turn-helix (wHTH) protein
MHPNPVVWRFDSVVIDASTFRVTVAGEVRAIEPKSFRLLQFLIENRGRAVPKEEILEAVWTGTFVSDNALTRAVAQVRKAIGDDPRQPRYIETIPTVGYRFLASVEEATAVLSEPSVTAPAAALPGGRTRLALPTVAAAVVLLLIALTVWMRSAARVGGPNPASFLPVQFSSSAGLDVGASFSPDGHLVAYASDKGGTFEIFVKSFDPAAHELQVTSDSNQNLYPAFSPDGRSLAFASIRRPGIFRVPVIGGPIQRLTEFGVQPVWSPDGRTIVFRSAAAASLSTTDYYWPAESSLWTVPAGGGAPTRITGNNGNPSGGQSFPSFSRDGAEIRFVNHSRGEASIWTYRISDGTLRKRFASTAFSYSNATFTPDDTRMWFVSWRLNGNIGIWQVALDPAELTPLGEPEPIYQSAFAVPRDIALSADGKRLAFTAGLSSSALLTTSIGDPGNTSTLTQDTNYRYAGVRTSADGTRAAYNSFPRNGLSRVWVVGADRWQPTVAGSAGSAQYWGSLTADNGRVCFAETRDETQRTVSQSLADGALRELSELPAGATQIAYSRDCGVAIFHSDLDERRKVYLQDTVTGTLRVIASGPEDVGFARFSRDDRWISVGIAHETLGGSELAVLPADGGSLEVILKSDQPTFHGGWMPDNDRLLVAAFREGAWNVYTVSRTTRKMEQLTSYSSPRTYVRYPDWLVGDRVVYEFNETKGNIFVATLTPTRR